MSGLRTYVEFVVSLNNERHRVISIRSLFNDWFVAFERSVIIPMNGACFVFGGS